jgi:myosin protein heavy chain
MLNKNTYRIGRTMAFFRIGVIADLEELRERKIMKLADVIQAMVRLKIAAKRESLDRDRMDAVSNLQKNARLSIKLLRWNWWHLFLKVQPLLDVRRTIRNECKSSGAAKGCY